MKFIAHPATKKNIDAFVKEPSHGLLVVGSAGSGKGYAARYIAAKLLSRQEGELDKYPYIKTLDNTPDQPAGIDDIRELKRFLRLKTAGESILRRFAIVRNAEMLGHEAQNAMLKILEEPPEDTCIILTASEPSKLKPTIISRLQTVRVRNLTKAQLEALASDSLQTERLYALSEGAIAVFLALDNNEGAQTNSKYIDDAKKLAASSRTDRLTQIDKITKDKEYDSFMLLDGLYKILSMKFKTSVDERKSAKLMYMKMRRTLDAQKMLAAKVQPKLVLSKLFYEL